MFFHLGDHGLVFLGRPASQIHDALIDSPREMGVKAVWIRHIALEVIQMKDTRGDYLTAS